MRKKNQSTFKSMISVPIKSPSPDFKAANMIKTTKTPQQLQYSESHGSINRTPPKTTYQKTQMTPKNQRTTNYKYFSYNRQSQSPQRYPQVDDFQTSTHSNDEIILQLRRIIMMINNSQAQSQTLLEPENSRIRQQMKVLQVQNQRLLQLISQLQVKSQTKTDQKNQLLQNEVIVLKNQMNKNLVAFEKDRQEMYRTNQTYSSQIKSLQDRRMLLEKENEGLRFILKEKEEAQRLRESQTLRKTHQKTSISMIKQQYNQSIKSLKDQITYDINYKVHNMEEALKLAQKKVNECESKVSLMEKVQLQNKILTAQVMNLKRQSDKIQKSSSEVFQKQILSKSSQILLLQNKYKDALQKISQNQHIHQQRLRERQGYYEQQLMIKKSVIQGLQEDLLKAKGDQNNNKQLQAKVYQLTIKLQQREQDLRDIERKTQNKVSQLMNNYETEIKILKSQIQNKASRTALLNNKQIQLEKEITYLKQQLENCRRCQTRETQSYQKRLSQLQITISQLRKHIEDNENKQYQTQLLQSKLGDQSAQIDRLAGLMINYQQSQIRMSNYEDLLGSLQQEVKEKDQSIGIAESQLKINKENEQKIRQSYEREIVMLKEKLKENQVNSHLFTKTVGLIGHDNIINQLNQLKSLISETKLDRLQEQVIKFSQMYQAQLYNSEEKIRQIEKLLNDKNNLQDQLVQSERMKLILQEKVRFLQSNSKIYEKELKERKQLCNSLIQQKSILQKDILLMKKNKFDHESIEATKAKAKMISQKIDNLLVLEQEREKKFSQITYEIHEIGKTNIQ